MNLYRCTYCEFQSTNMEKFADHFFKSEVCLRRAEIERPNLYKELLERKEKLEALGYDPGEEGGDEGDCDVCG